MSGDIRRMKVSTSMSRRERSFTGKAEVSVVFGDGSIGDVVLSKVVVVVAVSSRSPYNPLTGSVV